MKKITLLCTTILLAALALNTTLTRGLMGWFNTPSVARAEISGKDGELVVTQPNTIVNKYGVLAVDALAGSSQIAVNNPGGPNGLDITTLAAGDLIMVIQMSGASIDLTNTINYGNVTNLNNAGRHEFVTVNKVQGNTITINPPCGGLRFSYTASGKVQIIRVPQYTKLTINSGASLTAPAWDGKTGGVVVVDVQNNAIINGNIDVSSLGFRGGALSGAGGGGFRTDYVTNQQDFGAEKGEGIAGYQADYDLGAGRYGRGAAANAGGGGTAHNTGGGGGANGNNSKAWTGQGVMDSATPGAAAWQLDPGYIANGNKLTDSAGGGRGGYSYAVNNANALTQGPGDPAWGGDNRREVGGLGGRPVGQDTTGRIFMGGGGGAGAQNNDAGGAGGRGGGLIYIIADTVTGTGTLLANGENGGNTRNENRDGAGGAGAGGTIVVAATTSLTGSISAQANGGNGGNQAPPAALFAPESEGIGGGGGGGFIAFSSGSLTAQVNGGANGLSQAPSISEFPANGSTRGATGQIVPSVAAIPFCSTTSDLSITKTDNSATAVPGAPTTYVIVVKNNGPNDVFGVPVTDTLPAVFVSATWTCTPSAGSTCAAPTGTGSINTTVNLLNNGTATFNLTAIPDPSATGAITNTATVGMPDGAVDPNSSNNSASDTDNLTPQADLSITKNDGVSSVIAGTDLTYTITVRNNGPSAVNGATVSDIVPSKLTGVTWTCTASTGGSCAVPSGSGSINTTVNLLPSSTATFKLRATVVNSATGSVSNTATVTSPASVPDPTPANNSDTDTDTINSSTDLSITKTNNTTSLVAGTQTTYTIVASNAGPSAVVGATITDNLPVTLTNATWTCTASAGSTCGTATGTGNINTTVDLAVSGTATFTLTATVAAGATGNVSNSASITPPAGTVDPNGANNAATDTDTVTQTADLSITKTNNAATVTAGMPTTYTITARNNGPSSISGATVTDTLPATLTNATWTCTASAGSSCGSANGTGNINATVNLAANGTATFTLTATVRADATGSLVNSASIATPAGVTDPGAGNNTATDTRTIAASADLTIAKNNAATTVTPGLPTTYTIVVGNNGPSVVTGATVTDTLPSVLSNATWTCTATAGSSCGTANGTGNINATVSLLVGGTATFTLTATVSGTATGPLVNTATVAAPAGVTDPTQGNNSATSTRDLSPVADLSITKTNNSAALVPGTQTSYTIVVNNAGPSAATNVAVTDTLPSSLINATWTCTASAGSTCGAPNGGGSISTTVSLLSGGSATFTLTATIASSATGSIANTATITAPSGVTDPNAGNNSATSTRDLSPAADLGITKTNNVTSLVPGTQTTYTIVVSNAGPSAATNATVTDILPGMLTIVSWTCTASAGSSCSAPSGNVNLNNTPISVAVGGTVTFTVTASVSSTATGTVANTVTVAAPAGTTDPNSANNSATDTDTLTPTGDLAITKTDNATTVNAGSQITYTITASNSGPSAITNAGVTDTLPAALTSASWTCTATAGSSCGAANGSGSIATTVNLASGGTATYTLTATIAADALGSLSNTATIAAPAGTTDPSAGNNSATDTDTVIGRSNLRVTKTANPMQPVPGSNVTYTIVVTNDGPSPVTGAAVNDAVPSPLTNATWTCTASSGSSCGAANGTGNIATTVNLANGGTATFTLTAAIPANATGPITNTATVTPPTGVVDPESGNNSGSVTTNTVPTSDLSITKTASASVIRAGDDVTYTLNVKNNGPSDATGVKVTDPLPTGVTFISATSSKGTCSGTSTVICDIGTLTAASPGNTAVVTIKINVPFVFPVGPMTNTAVVSSAVTDPTGSNDSGGSTITVNPAPGAKFGPNDITVTASGTDVCIGGGNVLTVTVKSKNTGDGIQRDNPGPELVASLPVELTAIPGSCTASFGTCTLGGAQAEWNGEIQPNATLTVTFQVRVRQNIVLGTRFCSTFKVNYDTNSDGVNDASTSVSFCQEANCYPPPCTTNCQDVGPGLKFDDPATPELRVVASDQKPGSVLIYPLYTSSATNAIAENTRISLTNTHPQLTAYLHLFFVDGTSCSVADNFLCLTPNQTTSFLVSDLDPGVAGYVIAVTVDKNGCPANFNFMVGDEYVKLSTGHTANLGAEAVPSLVPAVGAADPFVCTTGANLATLVFDGSYPQTPDAQPTRHYGMLGRVLSADNLPSRADGNDTLLVVDRIGGNLGIGAATLSSLFGLLYNDQEAGLSFSFNPGTCQFRQSISANFPRTTPRFEQFVPAGRTGWMKLYVPGTSNNNTAIVGAVINATSNTSAFKSGHNLHKLSLGTTSLVIPIFPPSCQ